MSKQIYEAIIYLKTASFYSQKQQKNNGIIKKNI